MTDISEGREQLIKLVRDNDVRTERMVESDLRMLGYNPGKMLAGQMPDDEIRLLFETIKTEPAERGSRALRDWLTGGGQYEVYRGIVVNGVLVHDRMPDLPYGGPSDIPIYVYFGQDQGRRDWAREHGLRDWVVKRADPERLRGTNARMVIIDEGNPNVSGFERHRWQQCRQLVAYINAGRR